MPSDKLKGSGSRWCRLVGIRLQMAPLFRRLGMNVKDQGVLVCKSESPQRPLRCRRLAQFGNVKGHMIQVPEARQPAMWVLHFPTLVQ